MEWHEMNDNEIGDILKLVAPGTPLRDGIDNVLRAKTGGLIVLGYGENVRELVDGGFHIQSDFTPAHLYELAKMDGALILNDEGTKILYANAQLMPDPQIISTETGMRHRTAERVAKQTGSLVIAISQRRNVITLYKSSLRYSLKDIGVILTKANQAIQTLEKYKNVLDQSITNLGAMEFENMVSFSEVIQVIHRIEMVLRTKTEIINYVNELGTEGRLIQLQMTELVSNIEEEAELLLKDYSKRPDYEPYYLLRKMQEVTNTELLSDEQVLKLLGYSPNVKLADAIHPRGYRILSRIPRLPPLIIEHLVEKFGTLDDMIQASTKDLVEVDGVGEIRATKIRDGLERIQEQLFVDRHI
ncbi:DNA integrity scanning diadenylate cyclase DisA [Halobacillus yeomjeoni]|uniref:DNA integrity scanning protein DisA n=1 Tax=Halobacillus yeomjeoni TaxID=311194 RepID=A0A931HZ24_9BACI|nr:DNA integrity scanning diadenylate cyclase DisA [Halobacillus yeomjeoni]MBH0231746.1 DNA integrity scanning protein DisA [Halobacillus yeomjeoni]MCA0985541.1 DNA integrity scanning diadenylate cyclase DisA [Halobacillus yeomjeoni]